MPELGTSLFLPTMLSGFLMSTTAVGGAVALLVFARRAINLPATEKAIRLQSTIDEKKERLADLENEITEAQKNLTDRERAAAEAQYYRDLADEAKADFAGLEDARRENQDVEEQTRAAIEDFAIQQERLNDITRKLDAASEELSKVESREAKLEGSLEQLKSLEEEARQRSAAAQKEASDAEYARNDLRRLQSELMKAQQTRDELLGQISHYESRLEDNRDSHEQLKDEIDLIGLETKKTNEELEKARREVHATKSKAKTKFDELEVLQEQVLKTQVKGEALRLREIELTEKVHFLTEEEKALKETTSELQDRLGPLTSIEGTEQVDATLALADLIKEPRCLQVPAYHADPAVIDEAEALKNVRSHLKGCGLQFNDRVLNAFHTSLKINDISPMTVLAGVSGTGKSQLPRRYAEAMGINFLQVPVQPRWDSPQDLIGFYNYIEKQYRATELAQAMVYMDPYNWQEQAKNYKDRMLLVLLDEMNLARVEYYFSEFLSRLEARTSPEDASSPDARASAEISVDLSSTGKEEARRLYPGHNLLFVGTMNEDESTLSLSDKVLDRSNLMRFSKPGKLHTQAQKAHPSPNEHFLSQLTWRKWHRNLEGGVHEHRRSTAENYIEQLNGYLSQVGRPFGHRLAQAMLSYVANYPRDLHGQVQVELAMADQVEFRILPKLRGIDVQDGQGDTVLRDLADFARNKLDDGELASAIDQSIDAATNSGGLFSWKGRGH